MTLIEFAIWVFQIWLAFFLAVWEKLPGDARIALVAVPAIWLFGPPVIKWIIKVIKDHFR